MSMPCPRCVESELIEKERDGVTIDACVRCRGIWLDRGEIEKLIARASDELMLNDSSGPPSSDRHYGASKHRPARKRGWLGDFFD